MRNIFLSLILLLLIAPVFGQSDTSKPKPSTNEWYKKIQFRGYSQTRYNRLFETNPKLKCEQCDRSWGDNGGFFFRRLRLIFYGNISERVYIYIQPDFASTANTGNLHFGQVRDAYFDLALDKKKEYRLRVGQSKVPYGFENMQSSQNRLALDRNDALNSAVSNERDLGVFFYYAPAKIRERFDYLVKSGLKGSGDYGMFAFGAYNGVTANRPEDNDSLHIVSRITYPFKLKGGQIIEASLQGFTGSNKITTTSAKTKNGLVAFKDNRVAATLVVYPQPWGIQAEWTLGTGPQFQNSDTSVRQKDLTGGYVQSMYYIKMGKQILIPFTRYQYFQGGKKHEVDARSYLVREFEIGCEWQPIPNFELVAMYTVSNRTFQDAALPINAQSGRLLRLQAQFNF